MQPKTPVEYVVLALRVGMGLWFAAIGGDKLFRVGPVAFSRQVAEFGILQDPWNLMVAYMVPWLELLSGLALMASVLHRGAVRVLLGLTGIFLFANGQAIWRGLDPDCGCFGEWFELGLASKMVMLTLQLAVLAYLMTVERKIGRKVFRGTRMRLPT
jgi:uncharacterized membrane protein YphA (DoxX/SURF4 family)